MEKTRFTLYGEKMHTHGWANYGKSIKGKTSVEIFGKEKSDKIKEKLSFASSGENNPMYGKPSPMGSGNGWSGWYKGWYFRSLHELSYMINVIERFKLIWKSAEKKELKIFYHDFNGINKTYLADFLINEKYLVEIKPKSLHSSKIVQLKKEAALKFCENNHMVYKLLDSPILTKQKIIELYKTNQIEFIERYKSRVIDYLQI
jgi:hypothetical protein